jgi:hypothetical protein
MRKFFTTSMFGLFAAICSVSTINAQTVEAVITVKDITVDATSETVNTGIEVMPGDLIEFSVEGATQHGGNKNWTLEGDKDKGDANGQFAFKKANQFALVGWIGSKNNFFQVSKVGKYENGKAGTLFMAINDWPGAHYANNKGGLYVTVKVTRYYEIKAEGTDAKAAWGKGLVMIKEGDAFSSDASGKVAYWKGGDMRSPDGKAGTMPTLLAPQINQSALIARIGDNGKPIKLGNKLYLPKVNQAGWLYVTVNDEIQKTGSYTNNEGQLKINLAVRHPRATFKNPI